LRKGRNLEQDKQTARKAKACTGQKGKPYGAEPKKAVKITVTWNEPEATASGKLAGIYSERVGPVKRENPTGQNRKRQSK